MKNFYNVLANTLIANVTTSFLWFCLTFWVFLETRSVLATAIVGGAYMLFMSIMAIPFGTFVDHHKKKHVMQLATFAALIAFTIAGIMYISIPNEDLLNLTSPWLWIFITVILAGSVVESMRSIALSTTVTLLVPEKIHDKANGMVGTVAGISLLVTSVFSGLAIGFFGMGWALLLAIILILVAAIHLFFVSIPEKEIVHDPNLSKIDLQGSIDAIKAVPGLGALIFFTTFNNLLGGVYMALMDPYGLSLMSVQSWGLMWGVLSTGFIVGGILVSTRGLGINPLATLLLANIVMWIICIVFPVKSVVSLLAVGMFIYMCLVPIVESVEQTIIQKVVPLRRQGRVFGFAQAIESASTPLMAFLIAPIAQFAIIPAMEPGGSLASNIGNWFGTGQVRAIALIFIISGFVGLIMTLIAFRSRAYRTLSKFYLRHKVAV